MNHAKNLEKFATQLAQDFAVYKDGCYVLCVDDLPDAEQKELAAYYLESVDREVTECVHGDDFSNDNDYVCAIFAMLKNDNAETRENLAQTISKNIIKYFKVGLQDSLENGCDQRRWNEQEDKGFDE